MPKAKAKTGNKRHKTRLSKNDDPVSSETESLARQESDVETTWEDHISQLSLELLEKIFDCLPLRTVISCERLNHHFQLAVQSYLKVVKLIDLTEHLWHGYIPSGFTLSSLIKILKQCPKLEIIRGLHIHPDRAGLHYRLDRSDQQMIRGILKELKRCGHLRQVEISNLELAETLLEQMPELDLGHFANRGELFEADCRPYFTLVPDYRISKLHLTGVTLPELPKTPFLKEVILEWVELTSSQPFQNFACPGLRTFVMRNCFGPLNALKYVALIDNLARCVNLERLELVRVPFLGGLVQHKVEETAQEHTQAFHNLRTIVLSGCKNCTEQDLGYLLLAGSRTLENLSLQPCLTRDSLFLALKAIPVKFLNLKSLHLGYVDPWSNSGKYAPADLVGRGLAEITENPALLTDMGMNAMGQVFPNLFSLTVYNCPHLRYPRVWLDVEPVDTNWSQLTSLHLHHCHGIQLTDSQSLSWFVEWLPSLEDIHLERMFPKPPKGCSRVGLSAGTGIGVSSALVAMQNPGAQHPQQPQNQAEVQVPDVAPINQEPRRQQQQGNADRMPQRQIQEVPAQLAAGNVQVLVPQRHPEHPAVQQGLNDVPNNQQQAQGVVQALGAHSPGSPRAEAQNQDADATTSSPVKEADVNMAIVSSGSQESESRVAGPSTSHESNSHHAPHKTKEGSCSDVKDLCVGSSTVSSHVQTSHCTSSGSIEENKHVDSRSIRSDAVEEQYAVDACLSLQSDSSDSASSTAVRAEDTNSIRPHGATPKRNVRDASTSAMAMRGSCPIHGTMMQDTSDDTDDDSSADISSAPSRTDPGAADTSDMETDDASSGCQSVGVQAEQGAPHPHAEPRPMMCDQATSTSDPVMESDPVLIFRCTSQTLRSAAFDDCGISHIDMNDCPNLKSVQGHNLPIFKQLSVSEKGCNLSRVQFEQCPKMQCVSVMVELILSHPADRFIRLRPMHNMAFMELETALQINQSTLESHILLISDSSSPPQAHHTAALWDWMDLLSSLNRELIFEGTLEQARRQSGDDEEGIDGRIPSTEVLLHQDIIEVQTDIPWLTTLFVEETFQLGKPPPFGTHKAEGIQRLKEHLSERIATANEQKIRIFPHIFCVYVQTSDEEGVAVPEEFTTNTQPEMSKG